jgi:two-component system KDP operon response regulator KdpE
VVLDLGLPDMDGKEVLEKARAFYEGPILILSARDREAEKIEALDAAPTTMSKSPSASGELLARLRVACASAARPSAHWADPGGRRSRSTSKSAWSPAPASCREGLSPKEYDVLARLAQAGARC